MTMFHHACKKGFARRRLIVVTTPSPNKSMLVTVVAEDLTPTLSVDYVRYVSSSISNIFDTFARRERFIQGHDTSIRDSVSGYSAENKEKIVREHMSAVFKHVFGDLS